MGGHLLLFTVRRSPAEVVVRCSELTKRTTLPTSFFSFSFGRWARALITFNGRTGTKREYTTKKKGGLLLSHRGVGFLFLSLSLLRLLASWLLQKGRRIVVISPRASGICRKPSGQLLKEKRKRNIKKNVIAIKV